MTVHRLWQWNNIKPALDQNVVSVWCRVDMDRYRNRWFPVYRRILWAASECANWIYSQTVLSAALVLATASLQTKDGQRVKAKSCKKRGSGPEPSTAKWSIHPEKATWPCFTAQCRGHCVRWHRGREARWWERAGWMDGWLTGWMDGCLLVCLPTCLSAWQTDIAKTIR